MIKMKWTRISALAILMTILITGLFPMMGWAALSVYESGVANDQDYQEVLFITGQPIMLNGELKISSGREKDSTSTSTYYYKLENQAGDVKLTRRLTLTTKKETVGQQIVEVTQLDKITETITVTQGKSKATYTLKDSDYQFHKSVVMDHKAAVDYFSGNWNGRKVYTINKTSGEVVIEITGSTVGYNHFWGGTETQMVDYYLETDRAPETAGDDRVRWTGTAQVKLSLNRTKDLAYVPNEPSTISFRGGYLQTEKEENVLQYTYDLPYIDDDGTIDSDLRNQDEDSFKLTSVPTQKRLPVSTIRDVAGHWAEADITRMVSLGAFPDTTYFTPSLPMQRAQFARALAIITNMVPAGTQGNAATSGSKNKPATAQFTDVPASHQDYQYIAEVEKRGVMRGLLPSRFFPDGELTRAEAATILIRALGFDGLAPGPGYQTAFLDDRDIPIWAQDSIYMASELGLIQGERGYVYPNDRMTRAEAAALLNRLIAFLQSDLKENYRERVIYQR